VRPGHTVGRRCANLGAELTGRHRARYRIWRGGLVCTTIGKRRRPGAPCLLRRWAAAVLELATEPIYELIRTDQLRSRKAGSRRIIGNHLLEFLDDSRGRPRGWLGRSSEETVHGLSAFFHDRLELVPVYQLGCPGAGVTSQAGDLLDGHAGVGHEADEGVPELPRRPGPGDSGRFHCRPELAADVGGVEFVAVPGGEHRAGGRSSASCSWRSCVTAISGVVRRAAGATTGVAVDHARPRRLPVAARPYARRLSDLH